jgi:outer membrane receptor for ferrienterochelin and colicin
VLGIGAIATAPVARGRAEEEVRPVESFSNSEMAGMSLDQLLALRLDVASNVGRPLREQPGIVSVITADDIRAMGARSLLDVLRLVPGFDIEQDATSISSWAMRGLWAQEGKILLLVDGRTYNDPAWGNVKFTGRFPVENIEKIEIIRGPGSVQFGPYAELGVVKITTKGASQRAVSASLHYGHMIGRGEGVGVPGDARFGVNAGEQFGDLGLSLSVYGAVGIQSDLDYVDIAGQSASMKDGSDYLLRGFNFGASYRGLELRLMADAYRYDFASLFGDITDARYQGDNPSYSAGLSYALKRGSWSITPQLSFTSHTEHKFSVVSSETLEAGTFYDLRGQRSVVRAPVLYEFDENNNLLAGVDFFYVKGEAVEIGPPWAEVDPALYFAGESGETTHTEISAYVQGESYNRFANVTAGLRIDKHSEAQNPAVVPRLAITKPFNRFHFKGLYSRAFRMGDLEHVNLNRGSEKLKPENTQVIEFEAGVVLTDEMLLSANVFDITIDKPIVWFGTSADNYGTENLGKLGSRGLELEYRLQHPWGRGHLSYSYYQAKEGSYRAYAPASTDSAFIAIPQHKLTATSTFRLGWNLSVSPVLWLISHRYDVARDGDTVLYEIKHDPELLLDLAANLRLPRGLLLSAGVHDLLNAQVKFIQAYDSIYAPVPGPTREIFVRLTGEMSLVGLRD